MLIELKFNYDSNQYRSFWNENIAKIKTGKSIEYIKRTYGVILRCQEKDNEKIEGISKQNLNINTIILNLYNYNIVIVKL